MEPAIEMTTSYLLTWAPLVAQRANNLPAGSIPGSGRSTGGWNGNPLQDSCLGNPMDRGGWWATVHGITKSQTWLSDLTNKKPYVCNHIPGKMYIEDSSTLEVSFSAHNSFTDNHCFLNSVTIIWLYLFLNFIKMELSRIYSCVWYLSLSIMSVRLIHSLVYQ